MSTETTVVIVKPDALERGLAFEILGWLEDEVEGALVLLGLSYLTDQDVDYLYPHQSHQDFYADMREYLTGGPVIVAAFEGEDVIRRVREQVGTYDKEHPDFGTIRDEYRDPQTPNHVNLIHASASGEEATRELSWAEEKVCPDSY